MEVQLLWSAGCPNYEAARDMPAGVLHECGADDPIRMIEVLDAATGRIHRFPGSPTIRVNGRDVDPWFDGCDDDCTPRCRVYRTDCGLRGLPERAWITRAIADAR